jgi:plastocyanin
MTLRLIFVAVVVTLTVGCSSNSNSTAPSTSNTSPGGPSISIVAGAFALTTTAYSPNPQTISRGSTVTFINNDSTAHTATSGGTFDTGTINPGGRASVTLQNAGSITYHCTIHPGMVGTLIVQ